MYNLQIALEQVSSTGGDVQLNTKKIIKTIQRAQIDGAELIVFPELCVSGYGADDFFLRDQFLAECSEAVREIALYVGEKAIALVGYPEKDGNAVYSSIAILSNGAIIGNHRKTVIPIVELYVEHRYFKVGKKQTVIDFKGIKIGIIVSEELFDSHAIPECDLLCCCAAFPWSKELSIEREQYLHIVAREKKVPIIYVNNVGISSSLLLEGCSSITNEEGETLVLLKHFKEDCAITSMNEVKDKEHPVYSELTDYDKELYSALKYIIYEFVTKTPQGKAIVLMDGSINSQLVLYIAKEALGSQHVAGLCIQSRWDSPKIKVQAQEFTDALDVKLYVWELDNELIHGFISQAESLMDERWKRETYDRFKAGIFISVADLLDSWPLGCVDKTQVALGMKENVSSFTLTEFMPLTDIYHTNLLHVATYINSINDKKVFDDKLLNDRYEKIVQKPFLNHGQATKISEIDEILQLYIEKEQPVKDIISAGFDEELVTTIILRLHKEEWNRVHVGFSPKLSNRSFQNDWIFPSIVDWDKIDIKKL